MGYSGYKNRNVAPYDYFHIWLSYDVFSWEAELVLYKLHLYFSLQNWVWVCHYIFKEIWAFVFFLVSHVFLFSSLLVLDDELRKRRPRLFRMFSTLEYLCNLSVWWMRSSSQCHVIRQVIFKQFIYSLGLETVSPYMAALKKSVSSQSITLKWVDK